MTWPHVASGHKKSHPKVALAAVSLMPLEHARQQSSSGRSFELYPNFGGATQ